MIMGQLIQVIFEDNVHHATIQNFMKEFLNIFKLVHNALQPYSII